MTLVCGKQADILGGTTVSDNTNSFLLSYIHTAIVNEGKQLRRQDAQFLGKKSTNIGHASSTEGLLTTLQRKREKRFCPVKETHAKMGKAAKP